jgi:hypothetical protein
MHCHYIPFWRRLYDSWTRRSSTNVILGFTILLFSHTDMRICLLVAPLRRYNGADGSGNSCLEAAFSGVHIYGPFPQGQVQCWTNMLLDISKGHSTASSSPSPARFFLFKFGAKILFQSCFFSMSPGLWAKSGMEQKFFFHFLIFPFSSTQKIGGSRSWDLKIFQFPRSYEGW